jgi:hypothetical protein
MVRICAASFSGQCTEQELRTLHSVVTAFAGPRERKEEVGFTSTGSDASNSPPMKPIRDCSADFGRDLPG